MEVGEVLSDYIGKSIPREELFIVGKVSKLHCGHKKFLSQKNIFRQSKVDLRKKRISSEAIVT